MRPIALLFEYVWIALKTGGLRVCLFLYESRALFIRPASTDFDKFFFKTRSHNTIHTFKNYFAIVFSVFSNKRYPNKPCTFQKVYFMSNHTKMQHQKTPSIFRRLGIWVSSFLNKFLCSIKIFLPKSVGDLIINKFSITGKTPGDWRLI